MRRCAFREGNKNQTQFLLVLCLLIYSSFVSLCENRSLIDLLVNRLNNLSVAFVTSVPVISNSFTKRLRDASLLEKGMNIKYCFY